MGIVAEVVVVAVGSSASSVVDAAFELDAGAEDLDDGGEVGRVDVDATAVVPDAPLDASPLPSGRLPFDVDGGLPVVGDAAFVSVLVLAALPGAVTTMFPKTSCH